MDFSALSKIAINAALEAGKIIQKYMDVDVSVELKQGGANYASQVVTKVDKECESVILSHLGPSCKKLDLALLSEETEDDGSRLEKDFFWCIDPIDGTLAFINKHPGFSVSIALVSKQGEPQIGVVYDPANNNLYHAVKGKGAFKNWQSWKAQKSNSFLSFVTDRKLTEIPRNGEIERILNQKAIELGLSGFKEIAGGGAVMNAIQVAEKGPGLMFKFPKKEMGGGSVWDYAATACLFQELGLQATNFSGEKLDLNRKENTFMNHEGVMYSNV